MTVLNYRQANAPDMVKYWKKTVNDHVMMGRDSHLLKEALMRYTSAQILLGMHQYNGASTITIPQFLLRHERWLEPDEMWAEIRLAMEISNSTPPEFYIYMDNQEPEDSGSFQIGLAARLKLREWSDRVLG